MKGLLHLTFIILLTCLCVACSSAVNQPFMQGHDVGSGDYYLLAEKQSLLLDNPAILQQYQDELRIKKRKTRPLSTCDFLPFCSLPPLSIEEAGDNTLQLLHREKGLIRQMDFRQTYDMPDALRQSAKRLRATEQWQEKQAFLQRLEQLHAIEGVRITQQTRIKTYPWSINIYFPLLITPFAESFSAEAAMQDLIQRLSAEMANMGISDYQITERLHGAVSHSDEHGIIFLSTHYRKDSKGHELDFAQWPKISGYRADRFGLQINCSQDCAEKLLHSLQPLTSLAQSKVSQKYFIELLKVQAEKAGKTFDPEFTVEGTDAHFAARPEGYWENAHRYYLCGHVQAFKDYDWDDWNKYRSRLWIYWQYDLQRALQQPYPPELGHP